MGTRLKSAVVRLQSMTPLLKANLTAGNYVEYDSINPAGMPSDGAMYQGYVDGYWANMAAVRAAHPGKMYESVTVSSDSSANEQDIENGDATVADAPGFYKAKGGKGVKFYTSASNVQALINELAAHGIDRSAYMIRSAHYSGAHICAPGTCGYPQADATQYASNDNYDTSLCSHAYINGTPEPAWPLKQGDAGSSVLNMQSMLNKWATVTGFHLVLSTDGVFGPETKIAVKDALTHFQYDAATVALGQCDQSLWNHLAGVLPAPASWTYGAPTGVTAHAGWHSVNLTWRAPTGQPAGNPGPSDYLIYVYKGLTTNVKTLVATYPRTVTGTSAHLGGLDRHTQYTVHVVAAGTNLTRIAPDVFGDLGFKTS